MRRIIWLSALLLLTACGLYRTLVITRLSTATPSAGGTLVVFGRGFDEDLPLTVTIGDVAIPDDHIVSASNTRLELTVPAGTPNGYLVIVNADDDVAESEEFVRVIAELEMDPLEALPGTRRFPVTVRAKDAAGDPVPGARLLLLADKGKVSPDPHLVTDEHGEAFATLDLTGVPELVELSVVAPPLKAVAAYADPGSYPLGVEVVLVDGEGEMPVYLEPGSEAGVTVSTLNRRPGGPPSPPTTVAPVETAAQRGPYAARDLIVAYRDDLALASSARIDLLEDYGLTRRASAGRLDLVRVPAGVSPEEVASRLAADPRVAYAEPNTPMHLAYALPNDPQLYKQWGLFAAGVPNAWTVSDGSGVVVAVIDTAMDTRHPDLAAAVLPGYDFCADDKECVSFDDDPYGSSQHAEHGTHVAGVVVAAPSNGLGVAGVAPGARLLPVKVFTEGADSLTFPFNVALAIRWAAGLPVEGVPTNPNPARVINLSLGGEASLAVTEAVNDAVAAGAVVVAATGNGYRSSVLHPATLPNVVGVGAAEEGGGSFKAAPYSNFGAGLDLLAPGTGVVSTAPGGGTRLSNGTSMATPFVAGAAALLLAVDPSLMPEQVKQRLVDTAYLPDGADPARFGAGLLRVDGALGLPAPTSDTDRYATLTLGAHATSLDLLTGTGSLPAVAPEDLDPPAAVSLEHAGRELAGDFLGW